MKRTSLLLVAFAATAAVAFADPPPGPPRSGPPDGPSIERLAKDLSLDTNQQAAVKSILDGQHVKMDAERAQFEASGTHPSREEMHAKHEQLDAELRQQLAGVLTEEQLTKFDELRKRQRPPGPPRGERQGGQSRQ